MKTREQAEVLARSMVDVGRAMGVRSSVMLNAMDEPTGHAAGNALEVAEAVQCLQGRGPQDLEDLVIELAVAVSVSGREPLREMLRNGAAWNKFQQMVQAQRGDVSSLERLDRVHRAPVIREFKAARGGVLKRMDARTVGLVCVHLGAGRAKASDAVDFAVGCDQIAKMGTPVAFGDVLLRIHARTDSAAEEAMQMLKAGVIVE